MSHPTADPWVHESDLNHARAGHDTATVRTDADTVAANGAVLVVGGFDDNQPLLNSLEEHPLLNSPGWTDLPAMPTRRTNVAAAALGHLMYVVGGRRQGDRPLTTVEVYDSKNRAWADGPKLPERRAQTAAASLRGVLFVAGGFVEEQPRKEAPSNSLLALSPGGRWTPRASMPTARVRLRLVAAGAYLYAIGGQNAAGATVPTVERYDPATNTWEARAPMNHDRGLPGVVAITRGTRNEPRHFIVVVGGAHSTSLDGPFESLDSSEIYDVNTNT